jgi:hypothetical protein
MAAMALAAGTSAVASIYGVDQQRKQANRARDAQIKAETDAAQSANARLAARKRALAANSLVADQSAGMASTGRATLGGG